MLNIKTSTKSKDSTPSGFRRHRNNVKSLKNVIRVSYKYNFFDDGPARSISTGKEISSDVIIGLLNSAKTGNKNFTIFVDTRLKTNTVPLFKEITKLKISTGIEKKPRPSKPIDVLKEDAQRIWNSCAADLAT